MKIWEKRLNAHAETAGSVCRSAVKVCVAACVAGMCFRVLADATPGKVYRMKSMTLGTMVRSADDITIGTSANTIVPSTATLAFPGMTVADLWNDQYTMYGFFCGRYSGNARSKPALPFYFETYTNTQGVIEKAFTTMSAQDNGSTKYVKSVAVEYTNGQGGVYARAFSARYVKGTALTTRFVSYEADGTYEYYQLDGDGGVANAWSGGSGSYVIAGLTATRFPRTDMWLPAWENETNESVLTLDDIKEYDFHAFMTGGQVSVAVKGNLAGGYNKRFTVDGTGSVTGMTVEFQMVDDKYVKCVIVDFENGANGVVCKARTAVFKSLASGASLGFAFMTDNGTYDGTIYSVASGNTVSGYGVYELTATPPPPEVVLELDESKTWTQLVAGVDLGSREQKLNVHVTGDNPTLTFDTSVSRARLAFTGTGSAGEVTLTGGNSAFAIDRMDVGESLAVNMSHLLSPATVTLGSAAKIVYAPEGSVTLTSVFSGAGGVEIASGDVTMAGTSDYMGGTIVKAGAVVRPGCKATARGSLYVGPFGIVSSGNLVTVEPGGLYDVSGFADGGCWVAGRGLNPVVNTGNPLDHFKQQIWGLVLTGDMELSITNEFGLIPASHSNIGGLVLSDDSTNPYTLRKTGPAPFSIAGSPISVMGYGTFQICEGAFTVFGNGNFTGTGMKFKIDEGVIVSNNVDMTFAEIENNGTIVFTPNSLTNKIVTSMMTGTGTVVVAAANNKMAQLSFYSGPGRRYVIKSGSAGVYRNNRHGGSEYALNTAEEPLLNQRIDVEDGATFDLQGMYDLNASVTIAGSGCDGKGALVNRGAAIDHNKSQIVQLTLTDDASVGGAADFGILAPNFGATLVELGTHTLTIDTDARFFLCETTLQGNGRFNVARGMLNLRRKFEFADGATIDVSVGNGGEFYNEMPVTVRNFDNGGTVTTIGQMITVTGTVTGNGAEHAIPQLTLADGATIKIPSADKPLVVSQTLDVADGVTYTLDLDGFELTGDRAALLVPPSGADLSGVKYEGINLPNGTSIAVRKGVPSLSKSGIVFFIR